MKQYKLLHRVVVADATIPWFELGCCGPPCIKRLPSCGDREHMITDLPVLNLPRGLSELTYADRLSG